MIYSLFKTDVDTPEPDEKSLITYISSLYDVFPNPPALHPLYDPVSIISLVSSSTCANSPPVHSANQETQRKYSEYRELSSSLHVWIRESTLLMQDRTFPNTLIEVKKLALESNRFRTDEVPPRLREKQHITRLYKDIEVINAAKASSFLRLCVCVSFVLRPRSTKSEGKKSELSHDIMYRKKRAQV